jgi:YfiH family protein
MKVVTSALLDEVAGVRHAFFTRHGGVSTGLYESLNVGRGSKDDPAAVEENRRRAAAHFGAGNDDLLTCHQIHSSNPLLAADRWNHRPEGDAVVAAVPGLVCGVLSADCAPVLIVDPEARIAAAAHAGWRGALSGIVGRTVDLMVAQGADTRRMVAAVGPCIGPASYEVGPEFRETFVETDPDFARYFVEAHGAKARFDLPAFVLGRIAEAGVLHAEWVGCDTCADENFFSNRRATKRGEPDYGRLLSAITLV